MQGLPMINVISIPLKAGGKPLAANKLAGDYFIKLND
jgi:hypothetical protein